VGCSLGSDGILVSSFVFVFEWSRNRNSSENSGRQEFVARICCRNMGRPFPWIDRIVKARAYHNSALIDPHIFGSELLEVGAAEGWVGQSLQERDSSRNIKLLDVTDLNASQLPLTLYDGRDFPFPDKSFDTTIAMLVLHHCEDPDRVLEEIARVTRHRLIITESVYRCRPGKWLLWSMDNLVNGLRSGGLMPAGLYFRTIPQWHQSFRRLGMVMKTQYWISRGLHRHTVFVLEFS